MCDCSALLLLLSYSYRIRVHHRCSKCFSVPGVFLELRSWDVQIVFARLCGEVCPSVFDVLLAKHPGRCCLWFSRSWWLKQRGWVDVGGSLFSNVGQKQEVFDWSCRIWLDVCYRSICGRHLEGLGWSDWKSCWENKKRFEGWKWVVRFTLWGLVWFKRFHTLGIHRLLLILQLWGVFPWSLSSALDCYRCVHLSHYPSASSFVWVLSPQVSLVVTCPFRGLGRLWLQFFVL